MHEGVALVGFMGAGKTSVGRQLAEALDLPFVDLDERIQEREQASISKLFETRGEPGFRRAEWAALEGVLEEGPSVLACGGGTPCQEGAMELLMTWGRTVFLDVSLENLAQRELTGRPLWGEQASALYASRRPVYEQAHIRLDASQPLSGVVRAALACLELRQ
jgi:shikimate kinase